MCIRDRDVFKAGWLNEDEVLDTIKTCFEQTGYLLDTHTAVSYTHLDVSKRQS